jgi:hypothetical protein
MKSWFDELGDFPASVRDEVYTYFNGPGASVRSFVSRGLTSNHGERLGVLNLHAGKPNLLGVIDSGTPSPESVARRDEFLALMTPFLRELETAVELFRTRAPGGHDRSSG